MLIDGLRHLQSESITYQDGNPSLLRQFLLEQALLGRLIVLRQGKPFIQEFLLCLLVEILERTQHFLIVQPSRIEMAHRRIQLGKHITVIEGEIRQRGYLIQVAVLEFHEGLHVFQPFRLIGSRMLALGTGIDHLDIFAQELAILDGFAQTLQQAAVQSRERMVDMSLQRVDTFQLVVSGDVVCHHLIHGVAAGTPIIYRQQFAGNIVSCQSIEDGIHHGLRQHRGWLLGIGLAYHAEYLCREKLPHFLVHLLGCLLR